MRTAAQATVSNPRGLGFLPDELREACDARLLLRGVRKASAEYQAEALPDRLPGAGLFGILPSSEGANGSKFGREAGGCPAAQWGWGDRRLSR